MYNITLRRFRANVVAAEQQNYYISWVCICSLIYPACKAHVPYWRLWPARLYNTFPYFSIWAQF